jgi:hypothetical protein
LNDSVNTSRHREKYLLKTKARATTPEERAEASATLERFAEVKEDLDAAQRAVVARLDDSQFIAGFGSNGGEEFLSYMNISETLAGTGGPEWERWDRSTTENLNRVQNADGSWTGHHCITGRTICTGAALLVLMGDRTPILNRGGVDWERWQKLRELQARCEELPPAQLVEAFKAPDVLERLAAVKVANQKGLDMPEEFIALLRGEDDAIRQEAREALVKLAGGSDYGPSEKSDAAAVEEAVQGWQSWLAERQRLRRLRELQAKCEKLPSAQLVEAFNGSDSLERLAAVKTASQKGLDVPKKYIALLRGEDDAIRQEARQALAKLAGDYDFGPSAAAGQAEITRAATAWTKWLQRRELMPKYANLSPEALAEAFKSPEPLERWAAVATARVQQAPLRDELIALVRDPDNEVRQESRSALRQLARGTDHGPRDGATKAQQEAAFQAWNEWRKAEEIRFEQTAQRELKRAELLLRRNPVAAKRRMEEILSKYAGTTASDKARRFLGSME